MKDPEQRPTLSRYDRRIDIKPAKRPPMKDRPSRESNAVDDQVRADLLVQWAQMESSGIDTFRAMEILRDGADPATATPIARALEWMKTGVSPAGSWSRAGLLYDWQSELIDAGFAGGRGEWALRSMAENLTARAARWKQFKGKMVFPLAVMTLAGFLAALPPLVANQIGFFGFLIRIAFLPAVTVGLILLGVRLLQSAEDSPVSDFIVNLPVIDRWLELRRCADFLAITTQALKAGIPALQAIPLASGAIRPPVLGRRYAKVHDLVAGGMPVAEAFKQEGILDDAGFALVNAGEHSGALDDMLERRADAVDREAREYADRIATWVPRLIYFMVAGLMIISIAGFWTSLPRVG